MTESQQQQALMTWHRAHVCDIPEMSRLFAIPNGGFRHISTAARMRAEGVRAGVWDLCMPTEEDNLWIEMKVGSNRLTEAQSDWLANGVQRDCYYVAYDWVGAALAIVNHTMRPGAPNIERKERLISDLVRPCRLHFLVPGSLDDYIVYGNQGSCLPRSLGREPIRTELLGQRIPIRQGRDGQST